MMCTSKKFAGVVQIYLLVVLVHFSDSLDCFNCTYSEESCKDELFLENTQTSVDCGTGSCIKSKLSENGKVQRYCEPTRQAAGCLTTPDLTICACHYKDDCNGPVGADTAATDGLLCYDCYLNPECSDEKFGSNFQVQVDCGTGSCIKTKIKENGQVHRHCSSTRFTQGCSDQTFDGVPAESCACHDKDGCNDATGIQWPHMTYGLLFIVISFYVY